MLSKQIANIFSDTSLKKAKPFLKSNSGGRDGKLKFIDWFSII